MKTQRDVLFVTHTARPGGAELYLLDALKGAPNRSAVLLLEEGPLQTLLNEYAIPAYVKPLPSGLASITRSGHLWQEVLHIPGLIKTVYRMARLFRHFRVIYANSQKAFILGSMAARLAHRPILWNLHDILTEAHFSRWHIRVATWLSNHLATRIIVNSRASRKALRDAGSTHPYIEVVYNGIDPEPFLRTTPPHQLPLPHLGTHPLVGVFGRLAPWKGQHIMLPVLEALPHLHVVFVGDALFPEDRRYATFLKEEVRRRGLEDRVHWAGFQRDIHRYYHRVDMVVHTSIAPEPFGRVVVEGMLAGKPTIAAADGGIPELLTADSEGLLYQPGNTEQLIGHIKMLLTHPDVAQRMGMQGRKRALRQFHVDHMRKAIWQHIDEVLTLSSSHMHDLSRAEQPVNV